MSGVIDYVQETPWAIVAEGLDAVHRVLATRMHEGKLSVEELEARAGQDLKNNQEPYLEGRTQVIPIWGIASKRMNMFARISGGVSYEIVQRDIAQALDNRDVDAVLLDIDSPGGTVDGVYELAEFIYASRGKKPMQALANGQATSAAYLIASATDRVVATQAAVVGSIGVITAHYDYSEYDRKMGVKRTYLTAGKYKAAGNDAQPLSDTDRAYIQERLDYLYTMFVDTVARNRQVSAETVLEEMADGRIFIGQQAVAAGLADGIGTYESVLIDLRQITKKGGRTMNLLELKEKHPNLVQEMRMEFMANLTAAVLGDRRPDLIKDIHAEGAESARDGVLAEGRTEGATSEAKRLCGLYGAMHGEEALKKFQAVADSGVTPEQMQAVSGVLGGNVQTDAKGQILAALGKDTEAVGPDGLGPKGTAGKDFIALVDEYQKEKKVTRGEAMRAVVRMHPEKHKEYLDKANKK